MCISKPDHRNSRNESFLTQTRINQIPKAPRVQGLAEAVGRGRLNQSDIDNMPKSSKLACMGSRAWSRIHPHGLIPTVTTGIIPACRFTGRWLHWDQDRLLTVMEARRAQGYPDDEVLIGRPANQWKIVGNSVARQVAVALGLCLREACLENERRRSDGLAVSSDVKIEGETVLSETDEGGREPSTSTLDDDDLMDRDVNILDRSQRNSIISVEIPSYDSSRSTQSIRDTTTITEPSSRDEDTLIPSKKRGLDTQSLLISDEDDVGNPVIPIRKKKKKKIKASPGARSSPIVLD